MHAKEYIEIRNGGYYAAGTRIGLDVLHYDFRRGCSPEAILQSYPSLGSLAKVYGAIAFMLDYPAEVEAYLRDQDRKFDEIKTRYPIPADMLGRFERGKKELGTKRR